MPSPRTSKQCDKTPHPLHLPLPLPRPLRYPLRLPMSVPRTRKHILPTRRILLLTPRRGEAPLLWSRPSLHSSHSALAERQKMMRMRVDIARNVQLLKGRSSVRAKPSPPILSNHSFTTRCVRNPFMSCSSRPFPQVHARESEPPSFWRPRGGRHRSFGASPPSTPATPPSRSARKG